MITQARYTFFLAEKIKIKWGCDMWSSPVKSSFWFICKQKAINEILRLHPTYRCRQPIGWVCIWNPQQPTITAGQLKQTQIETRVSQLVCCALSIQAVQIGALIQLDCLDSINKTNTLPSRMKIYTGFNLASWLRLVKFAQLNISELWLWNFNYNV